MLRPRSVRARTRPRTTAVIAAVCGLLGLLAPSAGAAIVTTPATAAQAAQALAGRGVEISNARFTGAPQALGTFTGGAQAIGFASGVVLSTGDVALVPGPNDRDDAGVDNGLPGDAALLGSTFDAAALSFDLRPDRSIAKFTSVFGSEEYNEFVDTDKNDVFAFLVNGVNCAMVPGTTDEVSINNVNAGKNPAFFRNNRPNGVPGPLDTQLDGLTTAFPCESLVMANAVNTIKLVIADRGDGDFDSDVFLDAASFTTAAECEDGIDNDADGKVDFPADPGCTGAKDTSERDDAPTARFDVSPASPQAGRPATIDASASTDPRGAVTNFAFDPGTGRFEDNGASAAFTTTFTSTGDRTLRVRVTDAAGATDTASRTITVVAPDTDGDGVVDATDDCVSVPNPGQEDADLDGVGNACDPTDDRPFLAPFGNGAAFGEFDANDCPGASGGDRDNDGIDDACDTSDASVGPTLGRTVVASVVQDPVFVRRPGGAASRAAQTPAAPKGFVPLKGAEVLPVGTIIDAAKGRLDLTAAAGKAKQKALTQRADFYDGIFQVRQKRAARPVTDIVLKSASFPRVCGASTRAVTGQAAKKAKVVARLWGNGKGRFRTTGRSSAATVRGTIWLTEERCDGTLTRVTRGVVSVRDLVARRTVRVRAGSSYLARAVRAAIKTTRRKR